MDNIKDVINKHDVWLKTGGKSGERANLENANLSYVNLEGVNLRGANLRNVDFLFANLECVNLKGANLSHTSFAGANLRGANLEGVNLERANLTYTNLTDTNLEGATLEGANLEGANLKHSCLECVYLEGAYLLNTIGNMRELKTISCDTYQITYTAEIIQIGCERHKIEDWWGFDDETILVMDGRKALNWWKEWKPILKQIIEVSPAIPTMKE